MAKSNWTHFGIFVCLVVAAFGSDSVPVGYPALDVFRLQATSVMMPSYPSSSLAQHHSGTAVAELLVSPQGKVAEVKILESPDTAIGDSVSEAVGKWIFSPPPDGGQCKSFDEGPLDFLF